MAIAYSFVLTRAVDDLPRRSVYLSVYVLQICLPRIILRLLRICKRVSQHNHSCSSEAKHMTLVAAG